MAKRRILLVDDEVTVLLTMKAVLEISGFDVETAASAREGRHKIKTREYQMIITDMRMESEASGREVIQSARNAPYHPAVALLTAFPVDADVFDDLGADKMLIKPMQTSALIQSIEKLMDKHAAKLTRLASSASGSPSPQAALAVSTKTALDKPAPGKKAAKHAGEKHGEKHAAKKHAAKHAEGHAMKHAAKKGAAKKSAAEKSAAKKSAAKKSAAKKSASVTDTAPSSRALTSGKKTPALPPPR